MLVHDGASELVALYTAIAGPDDAALAFVRERLAWPPEKLNPPPLIDGSDLIRHGLAPSPDFARLLETVRDAQLHGEIETNRRRDDARPADPRRRYPPSRPLTPNGDPVRCRESNLPRSNGRMPNMLADIYEFWPKPAPTSTAGIYCCCLSISRAPYPQQHHPPGRHFLSARRRRPAGCRCRRSCRRRYWFNGNRAAWAKWVGITTALLLMTGLVQFCEQCQDLQARRRPTTCSARLKILVGLVIFFFAAILAGKTALAESFREKMPTWLKFTMLVGIVIVIIGGVMRSYPREPKPDRRPRPQSPPPTNA